MSAHLQGSVPKIDCSKPDIEGHRHKKIQEKTESCAFQRSLQFCLKYMRTYYKEKKMLPSVEEFRDAYRSTQGTGEELSNDRNRLNYIYEYVKRNFNPDKIRKQKNGKYITGEFLPYITVSDEEVRRIRNQTCSYRRNISKADIDLAAGYYFLNLIGKIEQKEFAYKDLSVPQDHLCKFFESHKNEGRIKYGCNAGKAKALREILIAMGWLVCVDSTYYTTKNKAGRARRYVLTPQFPRYQEFEETVGKDLIEQWTRKLDPKIALDQVPKKTG